VRKVHTCVLYVKHVPSPSVSCKAIYLFQETPCSPCGTILFRTKLICSKRMHRLVSVCGFYIRWRIHCGNRKRKVATEKESGISWPSDNWISSCSSVIRKFTFLVKQHRFCSVSWSLHQIFSFLSFICKTQAHLPWVFEKTRVSHCVPLRGKQKYQVTKLAWRTKLSRLLFQRIIEFKRTKINIKHQ